MANSETHNAENGSAEIDRAEIDLGALLRSVCKARDALTRGAVSSVALVETALAVTRERNPEINAFVTVAETAALEAAREADARRAAGKPLSPYDGIPIAVKDNIDVVGMPTSNGIVKGAPAERDADCMAPWRKAGFIVTGKLNMHEAALGTTTENPHFGATRNPLNLAFSAGGSSGGSGAAVAGGMVPLALGSDTMGSVRLPAASCGLVGFKPAGDETALAGVHVLHPALDVVGPLVNSVADLTAVMDVLEMPPADIESAVELSVLTELDDSTWDDDVRDQWSRVLSRLMPGSAGTESSGAVSLGEYAPTPIRRALLLDIEVRLGAEGELAPTMRAAASEILGKMLAFGERVTDAQRASAKRTADEARDQWLDLMAGVDVLVLPATPIGPTELGAPPVAHQADLLLAANLTGFPAAVMPFGKTRSGLPLSIQVMTVPGRERRLCAALEQLDAQLNEGTVEGGR